MAFVPTNLNFSQLQKAAVPNDFYKSDGGILFSKQKVQQQLDWLYGTNIFMTSPINTVRCIEHCVAMWRMIIDGQVEHYLLDQIDNIFINAPNESTLADQYIMTLYYLSGINNGI